jgi:zinc protease
MSNGVIPFPVETHGLANGLKLIVVPMPSNGLVTFWSIVRTGSRDEYEPDRTGFAHFFEHMMFRGTKKYPSERYQRVLIELGADSNAYTTDDLTAYHATIAAKDLERIMDLESDRFVNLDYSESDFKTEAGAVYGEYRKCKTDPEFVLHEAIRETAFERHTYGHTTMGYEDDVARMPTLYDYSRSFFDRYYRPDNTILLVVGDVDATVVRTLTEKYYAAWRPGFVAPEIPVEPDQLAEKRVETTYAGKTLPLLWLAYKVGRYDPANRLRAAADLLIELTFGETSAVYRSLVLKDQSIEFLTAYTNANRDPSVLDIYAGVKDPSRLGAVVDALDAAAENACQAPVDATRLENLKTRLRYGFLMQLETPDSVAETFARSIAIDGNLSGLETLYETYASLTPDDICQAAREVLTTNRRTVGLLKPARPSA